jgi:hypothetical protein
MVARVHGVPFFSCAFRCRITPDRTSERSRPLTVAHADASVEDHDGCPYSTLGQSVGHRPLVTATFASVV